MVKRLVVDDERTWIFDDENEVATSHARDFAAAKALLEHDEWDEIWLDHDLGLIDGFNGVDVARQVVKYVDTSVPIVVHSFNPVGAARMMDILRSEGFLVIRVEPSEVSNYFGI